MSVVPSSLDSSTRDVPPSTLAPDEKVEQPSVGTLCVTDRQRSPLLEAEQNMAPAAGRTGPLPASTRTYTYEEPRHGAPGPWKAVFRAGRGGGGDFDAWIIRDANGATVAVVDLEDFGQEPVYPARESPKERRNQFPVAEDVAYRLASAWEFA